MNYNNKTFDRNLMYKDSSFNYIGKGHPGGKAGSLISIKKTLDSNFKDNKYYDIIIDIPHMTVILTDVFDLFMKENSLYEIALSDESDDLIANEFQKASLPAIVDGDLYSLISKIHTPLAIRSSSLFEDKMFEPLAGIFETKMIPNNQFDTKTRFHKLTEAIKFVYASTFFSNSKNYFKAINKDIRDEKMAVVIQELVGEKYGDRFYPTISGVARSYNFYPTGNSKPESGVISLALGLGKTVVDGGKVWSFSPDFPTAPPPFNSNNDLLKMTQTEFWAVNMGKPPEYNPITEMEYLEKHSLKEAEEDKTINYICSTYDIQSDRINSGISGYGPRIINFAPVLKTKLIPFNDLVAKLLKISEEKLETKVEIEFAMIYDPQNKKPKRFGFLQVRPMVVSDKLVEVHLEDYEEDKVFVYSENIMGNGKSESIKDVVFVKPSDFRAEYTSEMALEIEKINASLVEKETNYLLIGFGRWGSSDPWLGIPVTWNQISGAKVIIESSLPDMNPDFSQGSHFFHNITSFGVLYFSCKNTQRIKIDWNWLLNQQKITESRFVQHVKTKTPIKIFADGRSRRGVILK
ncbi:MAG TPA: hypothetical protein ENL20_11355 [Candidatus Cloacimonetes bacterium]|nr:hypothetical protein [Candidatus Cloacimonadota bacterium]